MHLKLNTRISGVWPETSEQLSWNPERSWRRTRRKRNKRSMMMKSGVKLSEGDGCKRNSVFVLKYIYSYMYVKVYMYTWYRPNMLGVVVLELQGFWFQQRQERRGILGAQISIRCFAEVSGRTFQPWEHQEHWGSIGTRHWTSWQCHPAGLKSSLTQWD